MLTISKSTMMFYFQDQFLKETTQVILWKIRD